VVGSGYENEHEVGQGICEAMKEGRLRREDIFVSGKLWNTEHRKEHVRPACESLLKQLGLGTLLSGLVHDCVPHRLEELGEACV
jgi:diketogulonate reductase-like aldo/keto reductase